MSKSGTRQNTRADVSLVSILVIISGWFLAISIVESQGTSNACYAIFVIGVVALLANRVFGYLFYVATCILFSDNPDPTSVGQLASIHLVSLFGVAIMPIWTLIVFVVVLVTRGIGLRRRDSQFDRTFNVLALLFGCAALVGVNNIYSAPRMVVHDVSFFVNTAINYWAVRVLFTNKRDLRLLWVVLITSLAVRAFGGALFYVLGIGEITDTLVKPVTDSVRVLFPFLVLFGCAILYTRNLPSKVRFLFGVYAAFGLFNVIVYASRGNFITLVVGVFVLLSINRTQERGQGLSNMFRKQMLIAVPVVLASAAAIWFMQTLREGASDYVLWKLSSFGIYDHRGHLTSAGVRWLELLNITQHLWHEGKMLQGVGLGGYFTDEYVPFTTDLFGGDAFPDEWISANTLYKPHGAQLFVLLKMGIIGVIVYFGCLLRIFVLGLRSVREIKTNIWFAVVAASVAFLPLLYYKNFNSKIQICFGLVVAIIVSGSAMNGANMGQRSRTRGRRKGVFPKKIGVESRGGVPANRGSQHPS